MGGHTFGKSCGTGGQGILKGVAILACKIQPARGGWHQHKQTCNESSTTPLPLAHCLPPAHPLLACGQGKDGVWSEGFADAWAAIWQAAI